jgi:hypothetical protein
LVAAVAEAQAGAGHQVLHGARYQNLTGTGERGDARTNVNGNAADIVANNLALAGMQAGANLNPQRPYFFGYCAGAAHAARRTVERGENAVAGGLDFTAAKASKVTADRRVVMFEQVAPGWKRQVSVSPSNPHLLISFPKRGTTNDGVARNSRSGGTCHLY